MEIKRAWSTMTIKAVDDEKRIIEGIATTPSTDRYGDIVQPKGAKFTLPFPFLWQHDSHQPIGHVVDAKVTDAGIWIQVQLANVLEPGKLKDRLDEAWQSIKSGLVRGLSIGFMPIKSLDIENSWAQEYVEWDWLETSAVTIPANVDGSITSVKSVDKKAIKKNSPVFLEGVKPAKKEEERVAPEPKKKKVAHLN
jgi:HK97 family phage prohead protease